MNKKQKKNLQRIIAAVVLVLILKLLPQFPTPVELALYCIPYLVVGWDVLRKALLGIKNRQPFDECFLMAVATVGAFALGDYMEGCAVIIFYQIGELFQSVAVGKSRQSISSLMDIRPDYANVEGEDGKLEQVDPEAAAAIHPNNQVRVLRALEHYRATGKRLSEQKAESLPAERPYRSLVLGLDFPERAQLYRRIDLRVDKMMENGLLPEAELVYQNRERFKTAAQAIGYKEFFPYFEGNAALEDCVEKLKQASRNYAKRQLTWFRHMDGVVWLDAAAPDVTEQAVRLTQDFLAKG